MAEDETFRDLAIARIVKPTSILDIDGIVAATREYPLVGIKKDQIDTALGYFENNPHRMRYHWFRSRGLFAGSGVVESGCKAVPVD